MWEELEEQTAQTILGVTRTSFIQVGFYPRSIGFSGHPRQRHEPAGWTISLLVVALLPAHELLCIAHKATGENEFVQVLVVGIQQFIA